MPHHVTPRHAKPCRAMQYHTMLPPCQPIMMPLPASWRETSASGPHWTPGRLTCQVWRTYVPLPKHRFLLVGQCWTQQKENRKQQNNERSLVRRWLGWGLQCLVQVTPPPPQKKKGKKQRKKEMHLGQRPALPLCSSGSAGSDWSPLQPRPCLCRSLRRGKML